MWRFILFIKLLGFIFTPGYGYRANVRGPRFIIEPGTSVVFSNTTGGRIDCTAEGTPTPRIEWLLASDSSLVSSIPESRLVLSNGSLYFPEFSGERFRPDVHTNMYKCAAANTAGRILSLDVHVTAVVIQRYESNVYNARIITGNTAVFTCHVPSYIKDYITVTSWVQDNAFNIYPTTVGDSKHLMLFTGELHVMNADVGDTQTSYRCRTLHRLTGYTQESKTAGRLILDEPKGPVPPKMVVDKLNHHPGKIVVRRGEDIFIPCVAQGFPAPNYWWFRKEGDQLDALRTGPDSERRSLVGGSLLINAVTQQDTGVYVCAANSTAGIVTMEVEVRVISQLNVHILPPFLKVDSGAPAIFTCITSVSEVVWLKDGQRLRRSENQSKHPKLSILSVQREDQGMYQCVVTTEGETAQAIAELRLGASKPQFIYQFIEQTLQPGPDVSLKCIATGQPTPQIIWTLDGFPLPQNDRFVIGQYVTVAGDVISHINISKVAVEDGGTYECSAVNRVGKAAHSAPLRVYGSPVVRKMSPISAVAGEPLIISCPAAGYPIHTITWEKDGRVLPINHRQLIHPNGTLLVENVQQKVDQGTYTCEARNRQGHSDRGSVDVAVMEPPSIFPFYIERGVELGKRIGIQCLVTKGDAPIKIIWFKDDISLSSLHLPTLTITSVGEFSSSLLIESVAVEHGGRYRCEAHNAAAVATHDIQLSVNVPPEIQPFFFSAVAEGVRVQATCNVHGGDLPLNITWYKDKVAVGAPQADVIQFNKYSSIMTMSSVTRSDSGNYTCVASNSARTVSVTSQLTVSVPPEWVLEPQDTSAIAGTTVNIHCKVDGFPQPKVVWRKTQGKQVGQFGEYESINGTLVINDVSETDEGFYLCEATNGIGAGLSAVIFLTINALPRFLSPARKEIVQHGGTANLQCRAQGDIPMTVSWRRDGVPLPLYNMRYQMKETTVDDSVSSQLTIHQATSTDSGKYVCIATNPFGRDEMAVYLSVQDVPEPPRDVHIVECNSRSIKLAWTEPVDNNSPILYYAISYTTNQDSWPDIPESGEADTHTRLKDLHPSSSYHIRVVAVNQLGPSPPSTIVSITTDPEEPSGPPLEVTATAVGPDTVQISWSPPYPENRNGPILGYYIGIKQTSGVHEGRFNYSTLRTSVPDMQPQPYVISDLHSYTQYKVTVQAFNSIGASPTSKEVTVTTHQAPPGGAPSELTCSALTSTSLRLNWSAPPTSTHNGILQGYKIFYKRLPPPSDFLYENEEEHSHEVDEKQVVLLALQKYSNYSVKVAAFTSAGVGVKSDPIYCHTAQDIAGAPAGIRCALSFPRTAIITWSPPIQPNGIITRYNLYQRELVNGVAGETTRRSLLPTTFQLQVNQLHEHNQYEWWVTATTVAGEGPKSSAVSITPTSRVPAYVVTLPQTIIVPWKSSLYLECQYVGLPQPSISWSLNGHPVPMSSHHVFKNGTLHIEGLGPNDSGNYTCTAQNSHSSGSTTHVIKVLVPPNAPVLKVISVTWSNITLGWAHINGTGILGYVLTYRRLPVGSWNEIRLSADDSMYCITGLVCGTNVQVSISALNHVGQGAPRPLINVRTIGGNPIAPPTHMAITSLPHSLMVHLERWQDSDCPISHFELEKKLEKDEEWILVSESIAIGSSYSMYGLQPATFYHIRVTAHNNAGFVHFYFYVSTLTLEGEINDLARETDPFYADMRVVLPISASVVALVFTMTTVTICLKTKAWTCTSLENRSSKPRPMVKPEQYAALKKEGEFLNEKDNNCVGACSDTIPEYEDEIYPYATFQITNPCRTKEQLVSSERAFKTFIYQGSGFIEEESYAATQVDEETDEQDQNPGRSWVPKDYDFLASDSDNNVFLSNYLNSSKNIRHSRLVSALESSTSNEATPRGSPNRRNQPRKGRLKIHSPMEKNAVVVMKGGSSGAEAKETAFAFPTPTVKLQDKRNSTEYDPNLPFHHYRV